MSDNDVLQILNRLDRIETKLDGFTTRLVNTERDVLDIFNQIKEEVRERVLCKADEDFKIDTLTKIAAPVKEVDGILKWVKKRWVIVLITLAIGSLILIGLYTFIKSLPAEKIAEIIKIMFVK